MADEKVSALTTVSPPSPSDLLYVVDNPGGSPVDRKATIASVVNAVAPQQVLIYENTLVAPAANFDITGISQDYDDLTVLLSTRLTATYSFVTVTFNNDSGANYRAQYILCYGTSAEQIAENSLFLARSNPSSAPASAFHTTEIYIPFYASTTKLKIAYNTGWGRQQTSQVVYLRQAAIWETGGTAAITRLTIDPASGSLDTGSSIKVIGVTY